MHVFHRVAQPAKNFGSNVGGVSPSFKNMLAVWLIAPVIEKSIMATGGTSRWIVTVFSMRNLDLTAAPRMRFWHLVTCIVLVTHWLSVSQKWHPERVVGLLTNRIESNFEEIEFHRIEFEQSRIRFGN